MPSPDSAGPLEVELKFALPDPGAVRARLAELGATGDDEVFEDNLLLDDDERSLRTFGRLLRLRRDRVVTLTHKSDVPHPTLKVRVEHELRVESFDDALALLGAMGLRPVARYQKYRQSFALGLADGQRVKVMLDRVPFGDFAEIEGSAEAIETAARALGLADCERYAESYTGLHQRLRREQGPAVPDMIFAATDLPPA